MLKIQYIFFSINDNKCKAMLFIINNRSNSYIITEVYIDDK